MSKVERVSINVQGVDRTKLEKLLDRMSKLGLSYHRIVRYAGLLSRPTVAIIVPIRYKSSILGYIS